MFSTRKLFVLLVAATMLWGVAASLAWAEPDPQIVDVLEKLQASVEEEGSAYIDQDIEIKVNGQTQQKWVQEVWYQDAEHIRVDRNDGLVLVRTPDNFICYEARANLALHMPKATMDALGDKLPEALDELGLGDPTKSMEQMTDAAEDMTLVGEVMVGEDSCIVVDVGEEALEKLGEQVTKSFPDEFELEAMQLTLDKEMGIPRIQKITMGGPATLEIIVSIWAFEEDPEVPEDLLVYSPPEGAKVIVWKAEDDPAEVVDGFRKEAEKRIIAKMQQQ